MRETWEEQLDRVRLMASGDSTWDLSENDIAALKAVLDELDTDDTNVNSLSAAEARNRELEALLDTERSVATNKPPVCGDCEYFDLGTMAINGHSDCLSRLSDRFQTYIDSRICKSGFLLATTPAEESSE